MVEDGLVGVEAAAWLRTWAGMSIEAKDGLLDNSGMGGGGSHQVLMVKC